jgi:hypothetical protein
MCHGLPAVEIFILISARLGGGRGPAFLRGPLPDPRRAQGLRPGEGSRSRRAVVYDSRLSGFFLALVYLSLTLACIVDYS